MRSEEPAQITQAAPSVKDRAAFYLIVHFNVLVCLFKDIIIFDAILYPQNRSEFLLDFTLSRDALESIIELADNVDYLVINIVYHILNHYRRFLGPDALEVGQPSFPLQAGP